MKRVMTEYQVSCLAPLSRYLNGLAEAGCTDAQIQAISNQSPQKVAQYRKRASRKKLSRAAMERTENRA
jgi:hypothetical protein